MKMILSILAIVALVSVGVVFLPFLTGEKVKNTPNPPSVTTPLDKIGEGASSSTGDRKTAPVAEVPGDSMLQGVVMPGPLVKAHAEVAKACTQCHEPFNKTVQNGLCLECHKETADDIAKKTGLHGKVVGIKEQHCQECHPDHIGADANIAAFDIASFRHDLTDYPLKGAHALPSITCKDCHKDGKKYREAPSSCYDCHSRDDRHEGKLGKNCTDCHNEVSWKDTKFDHDKTKFPLKGKHDKVSCDACHLNQTYKGAPSECAACHTVNDIHNTPADVKCDKCHNNEGWDKVSFDHNKNTKFIRREAHEKLDCIACHRDLLFSDKPGMTCVSCHTADDVHRGRNGTSCEKCHNEKTWKNAKFDHNKDTKFPLREAHAKVQCDACHKREEIGKKMETTCYACHQKDDVHKGSLGKNCKDCHSEKTWIDNVKFDHDLTSFPLIGVHAVTSCGQCHLTADYKEAKSDCISCHLKDDTHKGSLGTDCGRCHNPNEWKLWIFDHNKTNFPLKEAHADLTCKSCHIKPVNDNKVALATDCYSCHAKDSPHKNRFALLEKRCEVCHNSTEFKNPEKVRIKSFHKGDWADALDLQENCGTCHAKDDVHKGEYGRMCGQCHSVDSFEDIIMGGQ